MGPLDKNEAHTAAAKFALSIYEFDAVFTFIPKNACSTMRYSVALHNGVISDASDFEWIHQNNQTFVSSFSELVKARYTFTILRDPFRRLVSCFLDKIVTGGEAADTFGYLTNRRSLSDLTFREFALEISSVINNNDHWRPQHSFLVYREYDNYFCVENFFENAIKTLKETVGFNVHDARKLSRHGSDLLLESRENRNFAQVSVAEFLLMRKRGVFPNYSQMYDRETIDATRVAYAEDFSLYASAIGRKLLF
jgi:Sulfotransferase family